MKIYGIEQEPKPAATPVAVRRWYDRSGRTWVCQAVDADGNQCGDAIHVYSRPEAFRVELADFVI